LWLNTRIWITNEPSFETDFSDFQFNMFPSYIKIKSGNPNKFKLILQKFVYENSLYSLDECYELQKKIKFMYYLN